MRTADAIWPTLPLPEWQDTYASLHLRTQIVGKIRLAQTPWTNHSWHVPLYLTARGLTTSPMAYGFRSFEIAFDFVAHMLDIRTSDGAGRSLPMRPQTVADFHAELMQTLRDLGLEVRIHEMPNEIEDPIPFASDRVHRAYDREFVARFWRILVQCDRVMKVFRARFLGKCSPVHFFWGSFDLAVTRFSGRTAPEHPGGVPHLPDWVVREAYSHEVSSCGFWPGGGPEPRPLFYSYAYPEPDGFKDVQVRPAAAFYSADLREFVLPYDDVRTGDDPDARLLDFFESTYAAAADAAHWDRGALERKGTFPHVA